MNRWIAFALCAILGLVMLLCGLQVPAHLRAVDARVIQKAGRNTPSLVTHGLALVRDKKLGAAQLISQAAEAEAVPDHQQLALAVAELAQANPEWQFWGNPAPRLESLFGRVVEPSPPSDAKGGPAAGPSLSLTGFLVREENRARALELLRVSAQPLAL